MIRDPRGESGKQTLLNQQGVFFTRLSVCLGEVYDIELISEKE